MERIIELSYKHRLAHIGSCLTTYPILEHIYKTKKVNDIVILSAGHAGLSQYVILEELFGHSAEELLLKHGIHPHRDVDHGIHVSSGSLGSAILVATGMAMGNTSRCIHCIISDGECGEGSVWEALSFINSNNISNMNVYVNVNGYSAYDTVDSEYLTNKLKTFLPSVNISYTSSPDVNFMKGLSAHYHVLNQDDKQTLLCSLK